MPRTCKHCEGSGACLHLGKLALLQNVVAAERQEHALLGVGCRVLTPATTKQKVRLDIPLPWCTEGFPPLASTSYESPPCALQGLVTCCLSLAQVRKSFNDKRGQSEVRILNPKHQTLNSRS